MNIKAAWDIKVFQHGEPGEQECLALGYEPFSMIGVPVQVQNKLANTRGIQHLMILAFKKLYAEGEEVWTGPASG